MSEAHVYKMGQGEYLDMDNVKSAFTDAFGDISRTETVVLTDEDGESRTVEFLFVDDVEPTGLDAIAIGEIKYDSKKNRLAVIFSETNISDIDDPSKAREAITAKNRFLEQATGRSVKNRRQSMKSSVQSKMESGMEDAIEL